MIPEGWELKPFGEIASFKNGLNFTKTDAGQTIKIVGVSDFQDFFSLPTTENLQIIQVANKVSKEELLEDEDLLFVRSNGNKALVGRCMIVKTRGEKISFSGFTIRGRVKTKNVTSVFIAQQFRTEYIKNQMLEANGGTNISNLSQEVLSKLKFFVPPLEEQVKIAEILTVWDNALETLQHLIAAKLELKRGLMQQLLTGKKRFKEFETREKWKYVQFKEVLERITRRNTELNDNVLTISANYGLISQQEIFNKRIASTDASNYYLIYKNEFAYNKSYSIGYDFGAIKRLERYEKGIVSSLYICFGLKNDSASGDFYKQFFDSNFLNESISQIAQEGARNHGLLNISASDFFDLEIPFPPLEEQKRIAQILGTLDTELEALRTQLGQVKTQKKGLMQQLLTGKIRVNITA